MDFISRPKTSFAVERCPRQLGTTAAVEAQALKHTKCCSFHPNISQVSRALTLTFGKQKKMPKLFLFARRSRIFPNNALSHSFQADKSSSDKTLGDKTFTKSSGVCLR
jgi:hypothetical protein